MCVKNSRPWHRITAITFLVDWGDGESDHSAAHHYEQAGYYRVRVVGTAISQLDVSKCHLTELKLDKCPLLENLNCASRSNWFVVRS